MTVCEGVEDWVREAVTVCVSDAVGVRLGLRVELLVADEERVPVPLGLCVTEGVRVPLGDGVDERVPVPLAL